MDLQTLKREHVADELVAAIECEYATGIEARVAVLKAVEWDDDDVGGDEEEYLVRELRWEFYEAIRDGKPLTLGELALGAALYGVDARNTQFEVDCEDEADRDRDPYNRLPALCLARFAACENPDERLLLVGVIDGIVGIWFGDLFPTIAFTNDDDTIPSLLRHDTVEALEAAIRGNADILALIASKDSAARSVTQSLRLFLRKKDKWEPRFAQFRHDSEPERTTA